MPAEKRTRFEVFLPIKPDIPAYQIVSDWLAEELAYARTIQLNGLSGPAIRCHLRKDTEEIPEWGPLSQQLSLRSFLLLYYFKHLLMNQSVARDHIRIVYRKCGAG